MTEMKSIPIAKIFVPERLRAVEEDHALAIQASILEHGLLNPITVRSTPNQDKGAKPYTLVAGAHRLRAIQLNDEDESIDCIVVEADGAEAQLIEIEENVFRNDLSTLDRAVFIQTYRDVWEQKYGKIEPGRPSAENRVNLTQLIGEDAARGFGAYCANRLGLSLKTVKRSQQIAKSLPKGLREKLRGTPAADNQALLLKLAKMGPKQRAGMAHAIDLAEGDVAAAYNMLCDKPPAPDRDTALRSRMESTWGRCSQETKRAWVLAARAEIEAILADLDTTENGDEA